MYHSILVTTAERSSNWELSEMILLLVYLLGICNQGQTCNQSPSCPSCPSCPVQPRQCSSDSAIPTDATSTSSSASPIFNNFTPIHGLCSMSDIRMLVNGVGTKANCSAACLDTTNCVAFEWAAKQNDATVQCYVIYSQSATTSAVAAIDDSCTLFTRVRGAAHEA